VTLVAMFDPTIRARNSETKKRRKKVKIGIDVLHSTNKCSASIQFEKSKVEVTRRKNLQNVASSLFLGGSVGVSSAAGADCTLSLHHC